MTDSSEAMKVCCLGDKEDEGDEGHDRGCPPRWPPPPPPSLDPSRLASLTPPGARGRPKTAEGLNVRAAAGGGGSRTDTGAAGDRGEAPPPPPPLWAERERLLDASSPS